MSRSSAMIVFWFIFLIYTAPTFFVAMITIMGLREYEPSVWVLFIWGGAVTAFGIWVRIAAKATPQEQEVAPVPSTNAGEIKP